MTRKASTTCVFALATLLIGAGCGGSDGSAFDAAQNNATDTEQPSEQTSEQTSEQPADAADPDSDTGPGFGNVIEGTFALSGAADAQYTVGDDELAFQSVGGCQAGNYGFGVHVTDAAGTATYAMFGVSGQDDLSSGVTGEFVGEFEATLFPEGDLTLGERFSGPITMVISEHDTGGADFDLNERRMSVQLAGSVPSDDGAVDVDVAYRWVMGCP